LQRFWRSLHFFSFGWTIIPLSFRYCWIQDRTKLLTNQWLTVIPFSTEQIWNLVLLKKLWRRQLVGPTVAVKEFKKQGIHSNFVFHVLTYFTFELEMFNSCRINVIDISEYWKITVVVVATVLVGLSFPEKVEPRNLIPIGPRYIAQNNSLSICYRFLVNNRWVCWVNWLDFAWLT